MQNTSSVDDAARLQFSLFLMKLLEFEKVGDFGIAKHLVFISKEYDRTIHIKY